MQERETTTDHLANIIQVIRIGHRTGTLTVERGANTTFEEGGITFAGGQVIQAVAGRLTGVEALNWLNTWGPCRFRFDSETTTGPITPVTSATYSQQQAYSNKKNTAEVPAYRSGIPNRTRQIEALLPIMDAMGFSRMHRRLLLLIDGQRTPSELARLIGRGSDEVMALLNDLVRANFIQL